MRTALVLLAAVVVLGLQGGDGHVENRVAWRFRDADARKGRTIVVPTDLSTWEAHFSPNDAHHQRTPESSQYEWAWLAAYLREKAMEGRIEARGEAASSKGASAMCGVIVGGAVSGLEGFPVQTCSDEGCDLVESSKTKMARACVRTPLSLPLLEATVLSASAGDDTKGLWESQYADFDASYVLPSDSVVVIDSAVIAQAKRSLAGDTTTGIRAMPVTVEGLGLMAFLIFMVYTMVSCLTAIQGPTRFVKRPPPIEKRDYGTSS